MPPFFEVDVTVYALERKYQPRDLTKHEPMMELEEKLDLTDPEVVHHLDSRTCYCRAGRPCPGDAAVTQLRLRQAGYDALHGCSFPLPADHQRWLYKVALRLQDRSTGDVRQRLPVSLLWPRPGGGPRHVHAQLVLARARAP